MMEGPCSDEDWRTKSRAAPPNRHGLVISRGKASAQQSWTEDKVNKFTTLPATHDRVNSPADKA
jgi:hypothetical protein